MAYAYQIHYFSRMLKKTLLACVADSTPHHNYLHKQNGPQLPGKANPGPVGGGWAALLTKRT